MVMYRYHLRGDFTLFAPNDTEFVKRVFWRSRYAKERTWYEFMAGCANRLHIGMKMSKMPNTKKPNDFVACLIESGLLEKNIMN